MARLSQLNPRSAIGKRAFGQGAEDAEEGLETPLRLDRFLAHERPHRALFGAELARRGRRRCRSYHLCGLGGFVLGAATGLLGRRTIAATTVANETVVLRHMHVQVAELSATDPTAADTLRDVIADEQEHHDLSDLGLAPPGGRGSSIPWWRSRPRR